LSDVAVVERRSPTNSRRHKAPIITAGSAPRPPKTRFGDFEFKGGYPTAASSTALLDWLPAPKDEPFKLALRLYAPKKQVADGTWKTNSCAAGQMKRKTPSQTQHDAVNCQVICDSLVAT
jgi:hypothetical protein